MTNRRARRAYVARLRVAVLLGLGAGAALLFVTLSRPEGRSETTVTRAGDATRSAPSSHSGILAVPGGNPAIEGAAAGTPVPGPPNLGISLNLPLATWIALGDGFGSGRDSGRFHAGLDFNVGQQQPVAALAACGGEVSVSSTEELGLLLVIRCTPTVDVLYAYLGGVSVETAQVVEAGEPVGLADPALGFLHFEIRYRGNPVDPMKYMQALILPPPETTVTPPPTVPRPTQTATALATTTPGTPSETPRGTPTVVPTTTATPTSTPTPTATPRTPSRGHT